MNDTQSIKALTMSAVGATQLPGTALSFPRVASPSNAAVRQNLNVSSTSPTVLRISHQARSAKSLVQHSLAAIDQTLARTDVSGNIISTSQCRVAFQCNIPSDVTLTEYRAAVSLLMGFLLESDGSNVTALFNGEL